MRFFYEPPLTELIRKAIDEYNNKPLDVHNGYTPNQVFLVQSKAELPRLYTKAEIILAKTNRLKLTKKTDVLAVNKYVL